MKKFTTSWFKKFKQKKGQCFLCQTQYVGDEYDELKFNTADGVVTKKICRACADKIDPNINKSVPKIEPEIKIVESDDE